jgi:mitochondrial import inner membrane translocase subunit TIM23
MHATAVVTATASVPASLLTLLMDAALLLLLQYACTGSLGRRMACSSAILGLYFSLSESFISHQVDGRLPDEACTIAAGFATAALFRSVRGPKAAAIAGGVGAVFAGGLATARHYFPSL